MKIPPTWQLISELVSTLESLERYSKSPSVVESARCRRLELEKITMEDSSKSKQKSKPETKWRYDPKYGLMKVNK